MKKFIYMMMLAVGFMTSCSDDDVVSSSSPSVDNNKIVFTTKSDKMQTRGGVTLTSLSKFDVTAVTGNDALFLSLSSFCTIRLEDSLNLLRHISGQPQER